MERRREVMALQSRRAAAAQAERERELERERERQREAMREEIRDLCYEMGLDAWGRVAFGSERDRRDRRGRRLDPRRVENHVRESCLRAGGL
jgi:hypothetical protein